MINIKQLSQRYKIYDYNIGLIKATPTDVIFGNFDLCSVHWLKHKYRDRMFADPFILKETDDTLEILAEEALFLGGAATLVKLTVCTKTFQLVRRKKILSIKSHLSYPYILRWNDKVYILPENIASDKLKLYCYDEVREECIYVKRCWICRYPIPTSFMKTGNIGCSVEKKAVIRKNYIYGVLMIIFWGITIPRRESV